MIREKLFMATRCNVCSFEIEAETWEDELSIRFLCPECKKGILEWLEVIESQEVSL